MTSSFKKKTELVIRTIFIMSGSHKPVIRTRNCRSLAREMLTRDNEPRHDQSCEDVTRKVNQELQLFIVFTDEKFQKAMYGCKKSVPAVALLLELQRDLILQLRNHEVCFLFVKMCLL